MPISIASTTRAFLALYCSVLAAEPLAAANDVGLHLSVAANEKPGTVIGTLCTDQADCNGATYRILAGNDDYSFHVDPHSGDVILLRSPDKTGGTEKRTLVVEVRRSVTLKANPFSDDFAAHAEKLGADADHLQRSSLRKLTVEIEVKPVDREFQLADWIPRGPLALTVAENSRSGTLVAKLAFSTGEFDRHLQYDLYSQTIAGMFAVSSDGRLTLENPAELDFEVRAEFPLRLQISDRQGQTELLDAVVHVTDVNEAPSIRFEPIAAGWPVAAETPIGRIRYSDPDAGDDPRVMVESSDARAYFDETTGQLFWKSAADGPAPARPIQLKLTARDSGGLSTHQDAWLTFAVVPQKGPNPESDHSDHRESNSRIEVATSAAESSAVIAPQKPATDTAGHPPVRLDVEDVSNQRPETSVGPPRQPTTNEHSLASALNSDRVALLLSLVALAMAMLRIRALRRKLMQERKWAEVALASASQPVDERGESVAQNEMRESGQHPIADESDRNPPNQPPIGYASTEQLKLDLADLFAASDLGEALDLKQLMGPSSGGSVLTGETHSQPEPERPAEILVAEVAEESDPEEDLNESEFPSASAKPKSRDLDDVQLNAFRTIANSSARSALKTHGYRQRRSVRVALSGALVGLALYFPANDLLPTDPLMRLVAVTAVILTVMFGIQLLLRFSFEGTAKNGAGAE